MDIDAVRAALHGRYLVEQELGRGATGTVYLARSVEAQAQVAIKVLRSHSSAPEVRARLVQEAQSQSRISHPNILQVFEYDQVGEIAYLVMPFVKGQSLEAVLTSGALSIRAALAVGIAVASALECAHRAGLIHRDIKPSNVLLPGGDYHAALLTDFGLQGALDTETSPHAPDRSSRYLASCPARSRFYGPLQRAEGVNGSTASVFSRRSLVTGLWSGRLSSYSQRGAAISISAPAEREKQHACARDR